MRVKEKRQKDMSGQESFLVNLPSNSNGVNKNKTMFIYVTQRQTQRDTLKVKDKETEGQMDRTD